MILLTTRSTLFPYTTLFRSIIEIRPVEAFSTGSIRFEDEKEDVSFKCEFFVSPIALNAPDDLASFRICSDFFDLLVGIKRSEEHTSELQSRENLVCRLLLEK